MRSLSPSLALPLLALLAAACAPTNKATPYPSTAPAAGDPAAPASSGLVRYFDRAVDLQPFLSGFPFERWMPSLETQRLFFFATGDRYALKMLDLRGVAGPLDLGKAVTVSDVDWSKRSLWSLHHHAASDTLWLHADERNDERMNLWTLDLKSGALAQVSDHDYVYGLGFSADETQVAYLPRSGSKAPFRSCLRVMDVKTRAAREVVCDTQGLRFTWSEIRWSPEGDEVFFQAQVDGDRNRVQLVAVDLKAAKPTVKVLTDPKVPRTDANALEGWVDGDGLVFIANDDGYLNLHRYSRRTRQLRQLTRFTEDVSSARLVDAGLFAVHRTPMGSTLALVDADSGKVLGQQLQRGKADVIDGHGAQVLWTQEAPDLVFEANLSTVAPSDGKAAGLSNVQVIALPGALSNQIVQCRAEAVKIPTFDRDRGTGKPRELHAFVLRPTRPAADRSRELVLVRAFYGGENGYSTFDHVMCAAGLTVISPAVRGSDGFGKAFMALNDGDLGGDEIVDLFHVARWAEKNLGLSPRQIGVYGGSHGGYATMRALTFPATAATPTFDFGFGLAHAGFSDIKSFHDQCNIPDWVVLESGDPAEPEELARMRDRSPLSHVDLLKAPLLLTHGSNDWRVPVGESRAFHDKAKALGKPVTYVEFAGQGHHIEGVALQRELFQARFDFLMKVAQPVP